MRKKITDYLTPTETMITQSYNVIKIELDTGREQKITDRWKTSFPKELIKNEDLYKTALKKIMTTHKYRVNAIL